MFNNLCFAAVSSKVELLHKIASLFVKDKNIVIFSNDKNYAFKNKTKLFKVTDDCKNANFLILKNRNRRSERCINSKTYIFVSDYNEFMKIQQAVGAIFWQKGRLNLIFRENRLKDFSIVLPSQYDKYIE